MGDWQGVAGCRHPSLPLACVHAWRVAGVLVFWAIAVFAAVVFNEPLVQLALWATTSGSVPRKCAVVPRHQARTAVFARSQTVAPAPGGFGVSAANHTRMPIAKLPSEAQCATSRYQQAALADSTTRQRRRHAYAP